MKYRDFIIRRSLQIIPTLFGLLILIFFISRILPGDPARLALGPEATKEQVEELRRRLGLDKPVYIQFIVYVEQLLRGSLGTSLYTYRDVMEDIIAYFPATFELITFSMIIAVIIGTLLGIITAAKRNTWVDHIFRVLAFSGVSMPRFWLGIMLQIIVAYQLGLLPTTGRIDPFIEPPKHITGLYLIDSLLCLNMEAFVSSLKHIILPAITLALSPIAQIMRIVRASMLEEMEKDYFLVAKANGLPENILIYKYTLRNAFSAALTIIGLLYGYFLAGAFVVETVFSWPGLAKYGIRALLYKDFNAVIGVTLVIGLFYSLVNLVVDVLYGYLDPRIRLRIEVKR